MLLSDLLRAGPGTSLAGIDPRSTPGVKPGRSKDAKEWSRREVAKIGADLARYQEMLFANAKTAGDLRRVLLVLQAPDCGGKDGTVKNVAGQFNPIGLRIAGFGAPTKEELAHPFLWRIRNALPPAGYVGVFNRSHYEDVLVVRVRGLVPRRVWARRYDTINKFEAELAGSGLTLVKVILHISYEEQRARLAERLTDPEKYWKYNPGDIDERGYWRDYQEAYDAIIEKCSTEAAPFHVVPADRKWYRNWAVASLLREHLAGLGLKYPEPDFDPQKELERLETAT
ncbi:PPK2 family polyphosphate kinase [Longispora albida]|uniref:PPK2 family polyphosphate kinase n=1 Tax=Longispora albida TaxID=203523 RepID=UPI00036DCAC3|nr:PPK2 family polyphosphate kinase [Longispora albida]